MARGRSRARSVREHTVRMRETFTRNDWHYKSPRSYDTGRWQRGRHHEERGGHLEHWRGHPNQRRGHHKQRRGHYEQRGGHLKQWRGHHEQRGGYHKQRGGYTSQPCVYSFTSSLRNDKRDLQCVTYQLETLQNENPSKIVSALSNKRKLLKYIEWSNKDRRFNRKFIQLLGEAFKCLTTPALLLNVLNILKEHEFVRKSLDQLKASFEDDEEDKDSVINSIESIIRILIWTAQKTPSAIVFLHGSRVFLSTCIEGIKERNLRTHVSGSFADYHIELKGTCDKNDDMLTNVNQGTDVMLADKGLGFDIYPSIIDPDQCLEELDDNHCNTGHSDTNEVMITSPSDETMKTNIMEFDKIDDGNNDMMVEGETAKNMDKYRLDKAADEVEMTKNEVVANHTDTERDIISCSSIEDNDRDLNANIDSQENIDQCTAFVDNESTDATDNISKMQHLDLLFNEFKECLTHCHTKKECHGIDNLDEFRSIPIIPRLEDINGDDKPKLRAIKAKGAYKNMSDYLDIHFRLLREDFISPLRDAIQAYIGQMPNKSRKRIKDIKLYENVRIIAPTFREGIQHMIEFDVSKLGNIRWNMSKRLKYGSLVCLSEDNFRTCHFATISNSDIRYKRQGILHVQFEQNITTVNTLMNHSFTMVESPAYFEAYRHVLQCLQNMTENDFSLAKYIVSGNTDLQPPVYLLSSSFRAKYDLSSLIYSDKKISHQLDDMYLPSHDAFESLDVLKGVWPDAETLNLDSSQFNAFKAAMTSEISLIQGPPGCGKTYVGLKIVKTLLYNKQVWNPCKFFSGRLLVVCYTNHALDQFMEGICSFYQGDIVRVGSRSSSEVLKKHSLSNKRQEFRQSKRFPLEIYTARRSVNENIQDIEYDLNILSMQMRLLKRNIVSAKSLYKVMGPFFKQFSWEEPKIRRTKPWLQYLGNDVMAHWLGVHNLAQTISNDTFHHTAEFQYLDDLTDETITFDPRETLSEVSFDYKEEKEIESSHQLEQFRKQNLAIYLDSITENLSNVSRNKRNYVKLERERVKKFIRLKLHSSIKTPDGEFDDQTDVNIFNERFSEENRWKLYQTWVERKCNLIMTEMSKLLTKLEDFYRSKREITMLENAYILKHADVIGMTTTGASKINNTLKEVQPTITIVEEAAEVLESHLVSNLTAGCQHVILIGDHKQLTPKPEVYKLEIDYNLNLSLFERLINNGIKCQTLQVQHRMRPEIANNIRYIYEDLQDHDSVKNFESIAGVKYNSFFINHSLHESKTEELKSFVNEHEALYIVYLCKYLLLQGYREDKITVLTTYKGQMFYIKKEMLKLKQGLENVLVTVVDNYQGEENDIVLLSFVRSNEEARVGFVAKDNRVCVALSRAKKGMYAIGNFEQLSKASPLWKSVVSSMKSNGLYGSELHLICSNHVKDEGILAKTYKDFAKAPEGGCMKPCDMRLDCGHVCNRKCHVTERGHYNIICQKPCTKQCINGHRCQKSCFEECFCEVMVLRTLPCGHDVTFTCSQEHSLDQYLCEEKCRKTLTCGHLCSLSCMELCKCTTLVKRKLPKCGHEVELPCCTDPGTVRCSLQCKETLQCGHRCIKLCRDDCSPCLHKTTILVPECGHTYTLICEEDIKQITCEQPCGLIMECGHTCPTSCGIKNALEHTSNCPNGHMSECIAKCNQILSCGHKCQGLCRQCSKNGWHFPCYADCDTVLICGHRTNAICSIFNPCEKKCMRNCQHKDCERTCNSVCSPCTEPCAWECQHYTCTKRCGEICDRPRCDYACEKLLNCGHKCYGLCGDPCPLRCLACDPLEGFNNRTRCVQLQDCGHICPVDQMDEYMDMDGDYFKQCPFCYKAIVSTNGSRYEKVVNAHWKTLNECKAKNKDLSNKALAAFFVTNSGDNQNHCNRLAMQLEPHWSSFDGYTPYLNGFSIMWCAAEICNRHSIKCNDFQFPSHALNKYTAQSVKYLESKIKHCLNVCTERHFENEPSLSSSSEQFLSDTSDVIQKEESNFDFSWNGMPRLLTSFSRYNRSKKTPVQVKLEISDCLPYLTVEEETILEGKIAVEIEDDSTVVKETVHSLVNMVCQKYHEGHGGMVIDWKSHRQGVEIPLDQDIAEPSFLNVTIETENQSPTGQIPEISTTGVSCTELSSASNITKEDIHIIDRIKADQSCTMGTVSLDEKSTPKSRVVSTRYTIHLMELPWANFRSKQDDDEDIQSDSWSAILSKDAKDKSTNSNLRMSEPSTVSLSPEMTSVSSEVLCSTKSEDESDLTSTPGNEGHTNTKEVSRKRTYDQTETETVRSKDENQKNDRREASYLCSDISQRKQSAESYHGYEKTHSRQHHVHEKKNHRHSSRHHAHSEGKPGNQTRPQHSRNGNEYKDGRARQHVDEEYEDGRARRQRYEVNKRRRASRYEDDGYEERFIRENHAEKYKDGRARRHRSEEHNNGRHRRLRGVEYKDERVRRHHDEEYEDGRARRHCDIKYEDGHARRHREEKYKGGCASRPRDDEYKDGRPKRQDNTTRFVDTKKGTLDYTVCIKDKGSKRTNSEQIDHISKMVKLEDGEII